MIIEERAVTVMCPETLSCSHLICMLPLRRTGDKVHHGGADLVVTVVVTGTHTENTVYAGSRLTYLV